MKNTVDISDFSGLSHDVAKRRIQDYGFNEIQESKPHALFHFLFEALKEPFIALLLVCAFIYISIGSADEAILLFGSVLLIITISIYQERKADQALKNLKQLSSPRALVIRDSKQIRIPGREVVPGDLVILHEGDRVVADGIIIMSQNLTIDESLVTGESAAVLKSATSLKDPTQETNANHITLTGTLVVAGSAVIQATKTGSQSELGRIGKLLDSDTQSQTPLQAHVGYVVARIGIFAIMTCLLLTFLYGTIYADWKTAFLAGISTAISLLPEEFPVVLTIFLALGAWRLSKKNILTRRPAAIENLGAITVLCVDKTGTLTENKMTVRELNVESQEHVFSSTDQTPLNEHFHRIIEYAVLASHKDPFDPLEIALRHTLTGYLEREDHEHPHWTLVHEYPLSPTLLAMSCVWESKERDENVIAAKGAPEAITDLCHLTPEVTKKILDDADRMARRGLKILGIAKSSFSKGILPGHQHVFEFEFLGLVGFEDPLRPEVPEAISMCRSAGIRVIMITGDYIETARSIAQQAGLESSPQVLSGEEIITHDDISLSQKLKHVSVFARMVPQNKLRIVNALKASREVVAMTGDGVNDAPSLKWADVGIAMGARGTDVAREAADLVLVDDRFSSIVDGIRSGRRIYDNIYKSMTYLLSVHILIAGASILPVLTGLPLILFPVHLVFLELIIDPVSTLVFEGEPEDPDLMKRDPRPVDGIIFNKFMLFSAVVQGLVPLIFIYASYIHFIHSSNNADLARSATFILVTLSNLFIVLANSSWNKKAVDGERSRILIPAIFGATLSLLVLTFHLPYLKHVFKLTSIPSPVIADVVGISLVIFICLSIFKNLLKLKKEHY